MTKKQLWESKLSQRCKSLKEAYHDMSSATMSDGTQVMATGSTRSTRTYNYEDVRFKFSGGHGEGTYSWMNRPWQRFDFASALQTAMIDAGVDKEFARECIEKSGSLRSAIEFFAKNYKVDKKEVDKEESLKENESDMMNESEYQKTYDKIAQLEKRQKELKAKQKKLIANKASQEEIDKVSEQLGDIYQEIGECEGYIKELQSIDGVDESKKLGESYSEKELLDAVMDSFGFTEDEALEYIKKASDKTKQELVKGFRQDAKKNFYDESVIEEKLIKYAIDMVHWEPVTYLPEWAQIVDDNEYPIIVEAPENASIEDIKDELIKLGAHENVNADIEGDFEFDYEDIDYRVADESESLKEEIEEDDDKVYQIKYWLTEEDREEGFSDIFIDSFDSKQEAIMKAKKMVDRGDVASVEVFDADDVTEQPVYFYDGNEENNDSLKEEKNNDKGAKIASIIASALNKQGGHGPMGKEEVVADENTITLVSQAGLETYKFNNDGSVDNLSIDDMIKTMLEDGDIEEGEIEDIREEYSHFNSIKDLLQSNLTWFMELPEKLIIKKVEEILDEEKDLEEAQGKKEPGVEFVIFDASEEGKAPILGIRSTRVEAESFKNKLQKTGKYEYVSFDEAPKGRFKRGDDFWGPFYFDEEEKLEESKQLNEMVIDLILDRQDGATYSPKDFYRDCMRYSRTFKGIADAITRAMDEGTEEDVKKAICDYIRANGYNEKICDFVNSVQWLEESLKEARGAGKGQKLDKFFRLVGNLHKDNLSKEEIARLEKAKAEVERFEPTSEYEKKDKKNLLQQIERVLKDGKLEEAIDLNKHVWEGWTVQDFIDELEPLFDQIMNGHSWQKPFKDKAELKAWCIDNQPYYKRYIPGVVEYFFKKMKKNENLNEKLVAYDSKRWEPEDIELHKSINWKERNYEDFTVSEDSFETEVVAYELKGGPQRKTVKVVKHLRANPIYPPYYRATQQPFKNVVGPMYDGHKHGKYDIHDRYETQEVYDILSN